MNKFLRPLGVVLAAALVAACGSSSQTSPVSNSTAPGTLALDPPFRIASVNAGDFTTLLSSRLAPQLEAQYVPPLGAQAGAQLAATQAAQLLTAFGKPACGVDFYYIKFWTLGGAGETTESSGALMVPTGGTGCSGPRPIVLYAHGTNTDKTLNIADITNPTNTEGALIAAVFAAQGYIVVAPNYAGYDISTLGYHPFLDAAQQSGEMMNILAAARTALPKTFASATSDNGQLFVTGYSEGGHVAMATQRALQAAGATVTAAAHMSGPYALEAFGDAVFFGDVNAGSTVFAPLLTTSYQHAYGNIYSATTDIYSPTYATGIDTLLPSTTPRDTLYAEGLLPQLAFFDSTTPTVSIPGQPALSAELTAVLTVPGSPGNPTPVGPDTPLFASGFGSPYLIINDYRVSYVLDAATNPDGAVPTPTAGVPLAAAAPTQTFRLALYKNDLRNGKWAPTSPTLLCGADGDPTVFFNVNTETMEAFWSALPAGLLTVLDVNAAPSAPFAAVQTGFIASQAESFAAFEAGGLSSAAATHLIEENYHTDVAPFCTLAARSFFSQFLGS